MTGTFWDMFRDNFRDILGQNLSRILGHWDTPPLEGVSLSQNFREPSGPTRAPDNIRADLTRVVPSMLVSKIVGSR